MSIARIADERGSNCLAGQTVDSVLGREPEERTIKSVTKKTMKPPARDR
jgi:hypothetical protein